MFRRRSTIAIVLVLTSAAAVTGSGARRARVDPRMLRWYDAFGSLGRPLALTERGIDDDMGVRASRGPAIRASRTWLAAHGFAVICYWQHDNGYLGATAVPAGGYADPDGVAAYLELTTGA